MERPSHPSTPAALRACKQDGWCDGDIFSNRLCGTGLQYGIGRCDFLGGANTELCAEMRGQCGFDALCEGVRFGV